MPHGFVPCFRLPPAFHIFMCATAQDLRHFHTFEDGRTGILGIFQQSVIFERLAVTGSIIPESPGEKSHDGIGHDHCREIPAGQNVITDGKFPVGECLSDPFIHTFVMSADENEMSLFRGDFPSRGPMVSLAA